VTVMKVNKEYVFKKYRVYFKMSENEAEHLLHVIEDQFEDSRQWAESNNESPYACPMYFTCNAVMENLIPPVINDLDIHLIEVDFIMSAIELFFDRLEYQEPEKNMLKKEKYKKVVMPVYDRLKDIWMTHRKVFLTLFELDEDLQFDLLNELSTVGYGKEVSVKVLKQEV